MRRFQGKALTLEITGASHGSELGFRLEGLDCSAEFDTRRLRSFMARRSPGGEGVSARKETDRVTFQFSRRCIRGTVRNEDARPRDYRGVGSVPRPGHADFPQWIECGRILSGGGDNSGRMTAAFCAAGFLCLEFLRSRGISVSARLETLHGRRDGFDAELKAARASGDSLGGTVVCEVKGLRPGLGGALFDGLESAIAPLVFAIPGVRGIEFGDGFRAAAMYGSEFNDPFVVTVGGVGTEGNHHGGVLGGRATGMPLVFRVAMRPTPTIAKTQRSVDLETMKAARIRMDASRHDPAFVIRSSPVVEAAAAVAIADMMIADERSSLRICQVLTASTIEGMVAEYAAERHFTDLAELRADLLKPAERRKAGSLVGRIPVPVVLTFRRRRDGGAFNGSESARRDFFRRQLVKGCGFAYVDFEDDFASTELIRLAHGAGVKVICSVHCDASAVNDAIRRLEARSDASGASGDAVKLVVRPDCVRDAVELLTRRCAFRRVWSVFASGRTGFFSRVLAKLNRSEVIYATTGDLHDSGMVAPHELVRDYRVHAPPSFKCVFAVIGDPLDYTESPAINNAAYLNEGRDAVMIPIPCRDRGDVDCVCGSPVFAGLAVTSPYKRYLAGLVDNAGAGLDSVNTVRRGRGGRLYGFSTDGEGFMRALQEFLPGGVDGRRIAILGDGGASKAVQAVLTERGFSFEVFHRRRLGPGFDLIVNATPVDPVPGYVFTGRESVFDLGYRRTGLPPFAVRAEAAGCAVTDGRAMLRYQAEAQRRILLGGCGRSVGGARSVSSTGAVR